MDMIDSRDGFDGVDDLADLADFAGVAGGRRAPCVGGAGVASGVQLGHGRA